MGLLGLREINTEIGFIPANFKQSFSALNSTQNAEIYSGDLKESNPEIENIFEKVAVVEPHK